MLVAVLRRNEGVDSVGLANATALDKHIIPNMKFTALGDPIELDAATTARSHVLSDAARSEVVEADGASAQPPQEGLDLPFDRAQIELWAHDCSLDGQPLEALLQVVQVRSRSGVECR